MIFFQNNLFQSSIKTHCCCISMKQSSQIFSFSSQLLLWKIKMLSWFHSKFNLEKILAGLWKFCKNLGHKSHSFHYRALVDLDQNSYHHFNNSLLCLWKIKSYLFLLYLFDMILMVVSKVMRYFFDFFYY